MSRSALRPILHGQWKARQLSRYWSVKILRTFFVFFKLRDCISDECEIGGFQYHPIFHNQYGFDMENDIDGDPYTYIGPCGNGANCINHEIGWSCECIGKVTN